MLAGGIDGYPDAVIVAEGIESVGGETDQVILAGTPTLYDRAGGSVLLVLPFDATAVEPGTDGAAMIEEAMRGWLAFRHMVRE